MWITRSEHVADARADAYAGMEKAPTPVSIEALVAEVPPSDVCASELSYALPRFVRSCKPSSPSSHTRLLKFRHAGA